MWHVLWDMAREDDEVAGVLQPTPLAEREADSPCLLATVLDVLIRDRLPPSETLPPPAPTL